MLSSISLSPSEKLIIRTVLASVLPSNAKVFVFGSRANGKTKPFSDIDLAIDLGSPLSRREALFLSDAFEESDLNYRVDILDLQTASQAFKSLITPDLVALSF